MYEIKRPQAGINIIRMLQTTDPFRYHALFEITSTVNRVFCERQEIEYVGYIGIRIGRFPWHATFNRIPLLHDLLKDEYRGWIIYVDADAYVADLDFNIRHFLAEREDRAILGAPGGTAPWNINAGILFINFGQPAARRIVEKWYERLLSEVGVDRLNDAVTPWEAGLKDDQVLLHEVLQAEPELSTALERLPASLFGLHDSTVFRQLLRAFGTLEDRVREARDSVCRILDSRSCNYLFSLSPTSESSVVAVRNAQLSNAGSSRSSSAPTAAVASYVPPFILVKRALGGSGDASMRISEGLLKYLMASHLTKGFFDEQWYLQSYPDVNRAIKDGLVKNALEHYINTGYYEGRRPGVKSVDTDWYQSYYEDVNAAIKSGAIVDAAQHYNMNGYFEGRAATADELKEIQVWNEVLRSIPGESQEGAEQSQERGKILGRSTSGQLV